MNKRIKCKKAKQYILKHEPRFGEIWNKREDWNAENILSKEEQDFMDKVEDNMWNSLMTLHKYDKTVKE